MRDRSGPFVDLTHNALRIMAGFLFWQHGAPKFVGWFGGIGPEGQAAAFLSWPMGVAGFLEFVGGLLILIGLFTRPVAFVLAGEMAVAYFWRHFPESFWPIENGGELAALYCFVFLFLLAAGPGRFSVDGWLRSRRSTVRGPGAPAGRPAASPEPEPGGG